MKTHSLFTGLTAAKVHGETKLIWIRFKNHFSQMRTARISKLTRGAVLPEEVLEERLFPGSNVFKNTATGERFIFRNGNFKPLST